MSSMELLFESRQNVQKLEGQLVYTQMRAQPHPAPVLVGDTAADGGGVSIYGSVLQDGGRYRMWYQAWPRDWNGRDVAWVGYAESADGLLWHKPVLKLVEAGTGPNNLCDLGLHSPSVFIDPDSPPARRYRALGRGSAAYQGAHPQAGARGYYTAHSSDGWHWELDTPAPTWQATGDVIAGVYHPQQRRGLASLKFHPRVGGFSRRSFGIAEYRQEQWSQPVSALVPDEFDDVCAMARGYASGDYYQVNFLPAGSGTVALITQFRHRLPRTPGGGDGVFGVCDITLAYQGQPGDRWLHGPGRQDFVTHGDFTWSAGGIYGSSCPVEVGDEQRWYCTGTPFTHGWYIDEHWQVLPARRDQMLAEKFGGISFVSWPKHRLFGYRANPDGVLTLNLGPQPGPVELALNFESEPTGSLRVEVVDRPELNLANAVPLTGNGLATPVAWKSGQTIPAMPDQPLVVQLHLDRATVWAYAVKPKQG